MGDGRHGREIGSPTLGDEDQAFSWLEKAYAEKSNSLGYIKLILN